MRSVGRRQSGGVESAIGICARWIGELGMVPDVCSDTITRSSLGWLEATTNQYMVRVLTNGLHQMMPLLHGMRGA